MISTGSSSGGSDDYSVGGDWSVKTPRIRRDVKTINWQERYEEPIARRMIPGSEDTRPEFTRPNTYCETALAVMKALYVSCGSQWTERAPKEVQELTKNLQPALHAMLAATLTGAETGYSYSEGPDYGQAKLVKSIIEKTYPHSSDEDHELAFAAFAPALNQQLSSAVEVLAELAKNKSKPASIA